MVSYNYTRYWRLPYEFIITYTTTKIMCCDSFTTSPSCLSIKKTNTPRKVPHAFPSTNSSQSTHLSCKENQHTSQNASYPPSTNSCVITAVSNCGMVAVLEWVQSVISRWRGPCYPAVTRSIDIDRTLFTMQNTSSDGA